VAVFLCRDDKVHEVLELLRGRTDIVFKLEAGDADALLQIILSCSKL
jgi:hypothetical protein